MQRSSLGRSWVMDLSHFVAYCIEDDDKHFCHYGHFIYPVKFTQQYWLSLCGRHRRRTCGSTALRFRPVTTNNNNLSHIFCFCPKHFACRLFLLCNNHGVWLSVRYISATHEQNHQAKWVALQSSHITYPPSGTSDARSGYLGNPSLK